MVMLRPKLADALLHKLRPGQDKKLPKSKAAVSPKKQVKSQSEPKRSGFDWNTYNR